MLLLSVVASTVLSQKANALPTTVCSFCCHCLKTIKAVESGKKVDRLIHALQIALVVFGLLVA